MLKGYNANLADLAEAMNNKDVVVQTFSSIRQLARYSKDNNKVVSKVDIKKNKVLKKMLRELFHKGRKERIP